MNYRLAGTTGCANGNDGRYAPSQTHPDIMISDCAEPASAASREPRSSCASSKEQDRRRRAAIRQACRSPGELAALGGNLIFWNRHRSADQKSRRMARNGVFAFALTGRGVADFVQISFGREIKYLAGRIASSELLLNIKWLPHQICSRRSGRSRSDEACKHGDSR
ncbi:MAG: hypothetical protein E5W19_02510 [Mesorhizobium sp.]|nr:MAG: hypothetical protein E5W19_02510 [Mesorhizobium sp.]